MDRYRLYAGKGRRIRGPLSEDDFHEEYMSAPVARSQAQRLQEDFDWWVVFDIETGKFHATWSTGRTNVED